MSNAEIIAAVNRWQTDLRLVPLTCCVGTKHRHLVPSEVEGQVILTCPDCDYRQDHIPDVVLRFAASQTADLTGFFTPTTADKKEPGERI
jgi:hypothetical protein